MEKGVAEVDCDDMVACADFALFAPTSLYADRDCLSPQTKHAAAEVEQGISQISSSAERAERSISEPTVATTNGVWPNCCPSLRIPLPLASPRCCSLFLVCRPHVRCPRSLSHTARAKAGPRPLCLLFRQPAMSLYRDFLASV